MELVTKLVILEVWALLFAAYSWLFIAERARSGPAKSSPARKLLLAAPAIAINLIAPLILNHDTEPLLITPAAGIFSLAGWKLLALCLNRGPLTMQLTPVQFFAVLLLPIIPHDVFAVSGGKRIPDSAGGAPRGAVELWRDYGKQMACATLVAVILVLYPQLHWFPRHWLYTLCSCMFLGGAFDGLAALSTSALQIHVAPTFNRPWMSESLADFWARRWNLTTTYMMRTIVYEPIMEGRAVAAPTTPTPSSSPATHTQPSSGKQSPVGQDGYESSSATGVVDNRKKVLADNRNSDDGVRRRLLGDKGAAEPAGVERTGARGRAGAVAGRASKARRFWALQATFMFSGIWHILVFWYNTRVISARWAMFFIIQGPLVMVEHMFLRRWKAAGLPLLPHPVRVVLTNAALIAMAGPLFFGPADETGFAQRNLETVRPALAWLVGKKAA